MFDHDRFDRRRSLLIEDVPGIGKRRWCGTPRSLDLQFSRIQFTLTSCSDVTA